MLVSVCTQFFRERLSRGCREEHMTKSFVLPRQPTSANCPHKLSLDSLFRVSFSFLLREGGQNEIVWIIGGEGGKYVSVC